MPIDKKKYHQDWADIIRPDILRRDNYKCKHCGISNRTLFVREGNTRVFILDSLMHNYYIARQIKVSKIVLSIAHLDGCIENNDYSNLAALCQSCHLVHDAHQHTINRLISAAKKNEKRK